MTLVNMCNNCSFNYKNNDNLFNNYSWVDYCKRCPHNPIERSIVGGAEVVPDWVQYIKDTFWNKPELQEPPLWLTNTLDKTQTFPQQEQYKREIEEFVSYKNRNLLKTIGELPAEYRSIFKSMFDELTKQIVEARMENT